MHTVNIAEMLIHKVIEIMKSSQILLWNLIHTLKHQQFSIVF